MRLAGQAKLGYYPTPRIVCNALRDRLAIHPDAAILDPCCGTGEAIRTIADGRGSVYGIELDWARADEAKQVLDRVIRGDALRATIADSAFSLIFCNPPYDFSGIEDEDADRAPKERLEEQFLALAAKKLMTGGIGIFIVPRPVIWSHPRFARAYLGHFEHLHAFSWADGEYKDANPFRQTVLIGRKRASYKRPREEDVSSLQDIMRRADAEDTSSLQSPWASLCVPVPPAPKLPVEPFRSREIDPAEAIALARSSPLWGELQRTSQAQWQGRREMPPLPLRQGHIALILSTGLLDGVVGQGPNRHIVKGRAVRQRYLVSEETDEDGTTTRVEQERIVVEISALDLEGGVFTFTSAPDEEKTTTEGSETVCASSTASPV